MTFQVKDKISHLGRAYQIYAITDGIAYANIVRSSQGYPRRIKGSLESLKAYEPPAKISQHAKTCQICSRPIHAATGKIAHHGYERPGGGYQTASCYGAQHLPFEVSRDVLGLFIDNVLVPRIASTTEHLQKIEDGKVSKIKILEDKKDDRGRTVYKSWGKTEKEWVEYERGHPRFERLLEIEKANTETSLKHLIEDRKHQQKRYDTWKPAK